MRIDLSYRPFTQTYSHVFHVPVSLHTRCHIWPWLSEFSGVALSCFPLSRLTVFPGYIAHETGRPVEPIFQGSLSSVVSQETWHTVRESRALGSERDLHTTHGQGYKDVRIQGYLFASEVKMCTGICPGNVPFIQCINKQRKHYNYPGIKVNNK